ncbi:hypothetical protein [Streptomyces sp. NPDC093097]|uniref:DUF6197 family protein n=1 Tax=Streptomyces sp. NPDC093097 TaxID=3366027 RepID=UPI00381CCD0C
MPHTPTSPALDHPTPNTATTPPELSLDDRLTLTDAAMTVALDHAALAYAVNTAHLTTDPEPNDLDTTPTPAPRRLPPQPPDEPPTPIAALLQRAHRRLLTDGWCTNVLTNHNGARCLLGAIHLEAHGDQRLEDSALDVLLDAIRRQFGDDVDSVPAFNDAFGAGRIPIRMLGQAAQHADARGL